MLKLGVMDVTLLHFFIILRAKGNHVKLYQCAEVKLVLALESEDMM